MRSFIFLGGDAPPPSAVLPLIDRGDFLAAADSGLETAESFGLEPDLVVGDMDSLGDPERLDAYGGRIVRAPRAKDLTDAEMAIDEVRARGADRVILVGGGGGRLDHLLGLAALFERRSPPDEWICAQDRAWLLKGSMEFDSLPGDLVSIFPLGADPLSLTSRGLRWQLDGLEFPRGYYGISNEATGERVEVAVRRGRALLIRPLGRAEEGQGGRGAKRQARGGR